MRRLHLLESKTYVPGGNLQISLRDLPPGYRVQGILLRLEAVFTTGAAAALIPSQQLFRLFQNIEIGKQTKVTGLLLHLLGWLQKGAEQYLPAAIPATNATAFRRTVEVEIPWYGVQAWAPGDLAPQTEETSNLAMSIDMAAWAALDGGSNTWNTLNAATGVAGTVRAYAVLDESNEIISPKVRLGYVDWNGQSAILEPGAYEYLFVYNEDGSAIDSTQVITAAMAADGQKVSDPLKLEEYALLFNAFNASAPVYRSSSATVPQGGSAITHEPANTGGAAATVTAELLPLVFGAPGKKISQSLIVRSNLRVDFTGSKTAFRLAFKRIDPHDESSAVASAQRQGIPVTSAAQLTPKTESKAPLSASRADLAPFLPLRAKVRGRVVS